MINLKEVNQKFLLELLIIIFPIGILFSNILAEFIIFCIIFFYLSKLNKKELQKIFTNKIFPNKSSVTHTQQKHNKHNKNNKHNKHNKHNKYNKVILYLQL